jgi:uncharacterized protein YjaZ
MVRLFDTSSWVLRHHLDKIPLSKAFQQLFDKDKTKIKEEWFGFLMSQGMMPVSAGTKRDWLEWRKNINLIDLKEHMLDLRKEFSGPAIDIFLFPLNQRHTNIMEELDGKNGCTFPNYIIAFWKDSLPGNDQKALLLHEYHHACRIKYQRINETSITLLESMIMEGLAEWEVQTRLGKEYSAPWTKRYSREKVETWWKEIYSKNIGLRGRQNHADLLYGSRKGIPPLMGYQLGYEIVSNYFKGDQTSDSRGLLEMKDFQFLTGKFAINKQVKG